MPDHLLKLNNTLPRVTYESDNQWCVGYFDKEAAEKKEAARLAKIEADKARKEMIKQMKLKGEEAKYGEIPKAYS